MNARLTISNKLLIGFGSLLLVVIINGLVTYSTSNTNRKLNEDILNIYNPSLSGLQECNAMVNNSQMLIKNWVYIEKQPGTPDKRKLQAMHDVQFPKLQSELMEISKNWEEEERVALTQILTAIGDTLFGYHKNIMENLKSLLDYNEDIIRMEAEMMVEDGGDVIEETYKILNEIEALTEIISKKTENANREMAASFAWFQNFVVISVLIIVVIVLIVSTITIRSIVVPVYKLKEFLITMTKGILPKEKLITKNDEIGDMGDALNGFIESLRKTSEFAVEIGNGNYNSDYEALGESDTLGNALLEMRKNLRASDEANKKRQHEDEIRNWTTKGLADFGDILRHNSENMDILSSNVMRHLVDYLEVNQGAIYILNEQDKDNPHFEMKSAVAYNREKYLRTNFGVTEGLVGRCAFEKLPVYLREIPEEYIKLTSGLGGAEPNYLLLVPLVINDNVLGVVELASFNEIPQYQIDFLQTLGENIASTISNVRITEQTNKLLSESKMRGEELSSQEEELRQNMEELQATQEEAVRREGEMRLAFDAINNTLGTIDIDLSGTIIDVNDMMLQLSRVEKVEFVGKRFIDLYVPNDEAKARFDEAWSRLMTGESATYEYTSNFKELEMSFTHSFTPYINQLGEVERVFDLVVNTTGQKEVMDKIATLSLTYKKK
ncbi:MAG: GAF domain-containing protein [Salinivirgaceae bacterium]|nr:GAF domain-containing protein [Salinivirgaceae bacterium]